MLVVSDVSGSDVVEYGSTDLELHYAGQLEVVEFMRGHVPSLREACQN